jgi:hypothetical protein
MSLLPFPADSAEYEEFIAVTGEIARASETQRIDSASTYKTLKRVIRERDDAIDLAKKLAECGDPKPWLIQEWQEAKSKISLSNRTKKELTI